jgi:type IV fimbrial biogenesis protein FimT
MLSHRRGFTLIELMIGLALMALMLTLAMPSFSTMLQNAKVRKMAESFVNGLQSARTEAVKRNQTIEFVLTTDETGPDEVASYTKDTSGRNWAIRVRDGADYTFVESESGNETSNNPVTVTSTGAGFDGAVTFTGLGTTTLSNNVSFDIENPVGGACKTASGDEVIRCLRVVVTTSGRVRMCDPSIIAVGDTRAC